MAIKMVDLPIKKDDFPSQTVTLPHPLAPVLHHFSYFKKNGLEGTHCCVQVHNILNGYSE